MTKMLVLMFSNSTSYILICLISCIQVKLNDTSSTTHLSIVILVPHIIYNINDKTCPVSLIKKSRVYSKIIFFIKNNSTGVGPADSTKNC